ncbi:inactive phospholipase D5 isoform X2 [Electrophorus electricus]|uniref:inactive phospholipase D5 isoform X2 n=1 Tax=Electrophorus electricus TaxID=8005 RepID=UPI000F09ECC7|nr:inactive phospholipase D5 isoform X2 [Electrophorus electricus]
MKSQQKCIVVFALVCCFGVLVALIFSAVDVLGEDEGGITEENCSKNCRVVLVENIPEDISISPEGTMPLATGLHNLLDLAQKSVEIVSPWWALNATEQESHFPHAKQGQLLLQRLMGLKTENVHLKVASGITPSEELALLSHCGAEVHYLNMTALTRGRLHSSFWVVDRKHMYIGSAGMDWRSLSTLKELGVIIYECSCLVLDLHRIFSLYWQLQYRDFVPSIWSKRLYAIFNKEEPLELLLNGTSAKAYVSKGTFETSPDLFCPKDRTRDIEAIFHLIQEARKFIYISMSDYLPLLSNSAHTYWSQIDGMLREALILRQVKVRLLISCWEQMHPLTFNFLWSLKSLCMDMANCSAEAKFFSPRLRDDGSLQGINHHRYMVTDTSVYIGNFDWVGNEFVYNAGAGLVLSQRDAGPTVLERMRGVFDRDWRSPYSKTLQPNMVPMCGANAVFPGPRLKDYPGSIEQEHSPNTSL